MFRAASYSGHHSMRNDAPLERNDDATTERMKEWKDKGWSLSKRRIEGS